MTGGIERSVGRLLRDSLEGGSKVEIEGLGTFLPGKKDGFRFIAQTRRRVFIAYVQEDLKYARKLYAALAGAGFDPWLDKKKLLPGQNWPRAIETAIGASDFFVACFSPRSVYKRGSFHSELRYALECASRVPLDEIFLIPARLEHCLTPARIARQIQYVDLFPDWDNGVRQIVAVMQEQEEIRRSKRLPLTG